MNTINTIQKKLGLTVVILSHERKQGLSILLKGLLKQNLRDLDLEVIIINSSKFQLRKTYCNRLGRLLRKFSDVKLINCYNWSCNIRHHVATWARHDICLFLDDDVMIFDNNFVFDMWIAYQKLPEPYPILSSWCKLWTEWHQEYFCKIDLNFKNPHITEATECDAAGTGICMLNKNMLTSYNILKMTPEIPEAYDTAFSLIAFLAHGSRSFYFPAAGRMGFHKQKIKKAIHREPNFFASMFAGYKLYWQRGYQPVLSRLTKENETAVLKAVKQTVATRHDW